MTSKPTEGDTVGRSLGVALKAAEAVYGVAEAINGGLTNSLTKKLDAAIDRVDSQPRAAAGMLGAFINQVTALAGKRALSFPDSLALIAAAQNARSVLLAG